MVGSRSQTGQGILLKARVPCAWSSPLPLPLGNSLGGAVQDGIYPLGWSPHPEESHILRRALGSVGEAKLAETCRKN